MFGSTIGVAGKDLFNDSEIDLLIKSLMVSVLDCEGVDWGVFDVVLFVHVGL